MAPGAADGGSRSRDEARVLVRTGGRRRASPSCNYLHLLSKIDRQKLLAVDEITRSRCAPRYDNSATGPSTDRRGPMWQVDYRYPGEKLRASLLPRAITLACSGIRRAARRRSSFVTIAEGNGISKDMSSPIAASNGLELTRQADLQEELRRAEQDFARGDFVELTVAALDDSVAMGEWPWATESSE
jgi:hypothetical protein